MSRIKILCSLLLVLSVITIILTIGCSNEMQDKYDIRVVSKIKEYSPFQPKTQGLPLVISVYNKENDKVFEDFDFTIHTEYGKLYTYEHVGRGEYKVNIYGNEYKVYNVKTAQISWGAKDSNGSFVPDGINEIIIDIEVYSNSEIIAKKQVQVLRTGKYKFMLSNE